MMNFWVLFLICLFITVKLDRYAGGLVTVYTLGGFIHILPGLAIVVIPINIIQGRKAV